MRRMYSFKTFILLSVVGMMAGTAWASEAETSATARNGRGGSDASATARYEGRYGFARTNTDTGRLTRSRAVAVGVDKDGVSVSLSTAIAPRNGPALGANLNFSLSGNGQASVSRGATVARGGVSRAVAVGGRTQTATRYRNASSTAMASGKTSYGGVVRSSTRSETTQARPARIVRTYQPRESKSSYRTIRIVRRGR
jgi:hypothetical protein